MICLELLQQILEYGTARRSGVFFFNRHSYTNLKIVNWSKVSITEPDVKKCIDRK